ncbi:O-antigen ligase family protein [Pedobacter jeongneungensis]
MNPIFSYDYFYPLLFFFVLLYWIVKASVNKVAVVKSITLTLSVLDIVMLLFASVIFTGTISNYGFFKIQNHYTLFVAVFLYAFVKILVSVYAHEYILRAIGVTLVLLSGIEIVIGFLQFIHFLETNSVFYSVTGSFNSPTDYSNFLCSTLGFFIFSPILSGRSTSPKFQLICRVMFVLLNLVAIIGFTESRMSWITCIALLAITLWMESDKIDLSKFKVILKVNKYIFCGSVALIATLLLVFLVSMKQGSTTGRLFVMMNELSILKSNFLYGVGFGNFNHYYNNYQADYFRSHPNSSYEAFASYINVGYSEYLQLLVEGGLASLILLILIFTRLVKIGKNIKNNSDLVKGCFLSLISILLLGIFSFPFRSFFTFTNLIIFLAVSASIDKSVFSLKPGTRIMKFVISGTALALLILFGRIYKTYNALTLWQTMLNYSKHQPMDQSTITETYVQTFHELSTDEGYLQAYATYLSRNNKIKESTELLNLATVYSGYYMLYATLGMNYFKMADHKNAEKCFLTAAYMVPNRFVPKKLVMAYFIATGKNDKAILWAKNIISYKVKVPSKEVDLIKRSANKFLIESNYVYKK